MPIVSELREVIGASGRSVLRPLGGSRLLECMSRLQSPTRPDEVAAVAARMTLQVVLMLGLRLPEPLLGVDFSHHGTGSQTRVRQSSRVPSPSALRPCRRWQNGSLVQSRSPAARATNTHPTALMRRPSPRSCGRCLHMSWHSSRRKRRPTLSWRACAVCAPRDPSPAVASELETFLDDRGNGWRLTRYKFPGGQLSDERKAALPEAIKDAHAKTTGAPATSLKQPCLRSRPHASGSTARRWSATRSLSMASSLATLRIPRAGAMRRRGLCGGERCRL